MSNASKSTKKEPKPIDPAKVREHIEKLGICLPLVRTEQLISEALTKQNPFQWLVQWNRQQQATPPEKPAGGAEEPGLCNDTSHDTSGEIPPASPPPPVTGPKEPQKLVCHVPHSLDATTGYISRHVDVRLTQEQANALNKIRLGLNLSAARTSNGKFVESAADTIRWLLDTVAAQLTATQRDA